ncbi:MAG TPA: glycosyltransferase family 39 protein [Acidimicrobiales bacterium]|nr:glycosyltransferase family 39 protein [Acidimicrobiales bacterium]
MPSVLGRWGRRAFPELPPLDRRVRWALVAIVAAAALARIAWAVTQAQEPTGPQLRDPVLYLLLSDQVAHGHGFSYPGDAGGVTAYYPPGYPLFVAAVLWVVGLAPGEVSAFDVALWTNVVLSVATVPLVFALGRRLASPGVGLVAAGAFALWPNLVFHSGVVLTETLFLFLFVLLFLVALATPAVARHPGRWRLVTVGVLFGLTGLVRPVSLVIAPLFLVLWWSDGVRRAVRNTGLVGVATIAVIVPWAIRNAIQMDSPILLSANFGDNFCIGNNPEATGSYGLPGYCFPESLNAGKRPEFEVRRQSYTLDKGLTWLRENPLDAAGLVPERLSATLRHDDDGLAAAGDYGQHPVFGPSTTHRVGQVADAYYFLLVALTAAGFVLVVRRGAWADRRWQLFVLAAPVQLLSPLLTFGDPRFKMPIYPVLAVCAGVAVVALVRRRDPVGAASATDVPGAPPDDGAPDADGSDIPAADETAPDAAGRSAPTPST